jgi:hypothetical protein
MKEIKTKREAMDVKCLQAAFAELRGLDEVESGVFTIDAISRLIRAEAAVKRVSKTYQPENDDDEYHPDTLLIIASAFSAGILDLPVDDCHPHSIWGQRMLAFAKFYQLKSFLSDAHYFAESIADETNPEDGLDLVSSRFIELIETLSRRTY